MSPQEYAIQHNLDQKTFFEVLDYLRDVPFSNSDKVALVKCLVEDENSLRLSVEYRKFLNTITHHPLFEKYYSSWGKYRQAAKKSVNLTNGFEAMSYLNHLVITLEKLEQTPGLKDVAKKDISDLKELIIKTVQVCLTSDDVLISDEFNSFFGILYGIYEGLESFVGKVARGKVTEEFLHLFRDRTKDKAFRDTIINSVDDLERLKGLFSLGTHLAITAQNNPQFKSDSLNLMGELVDQIREYMGSGNLEILKAIVF